MSDTNMNLRELAKSATDDFYALLGVAVDAPPAAVSKAYRQASRKFHPDKNPDDQDAANRFIYLGWARDILSDKTLKDEYDRARARRREKLLQDELLDGERRKMKEDLDRREQEWAREKRKKTGQFTEAERREHEKIQEITADGKRRRMELQERREREHREMEERWERSRKEKAEASVMDTNKSQEPGEPSDVERSIKVEFKREGETADWDQGKISSMFAKYGDVDMVVIRQDKKIQSSEKKDRKTIKAFITYTRLGHAYAALKNAMSDYPLLESTSWVKAPSSTPTLPTPTLPTRTYTYEEIMIRLDAAVAEERRKRLLRDANAKPLVPPCNKHGAPQFFTCPPKGPVSSKIGSVKWREDEIRKQDAAENAKASRKL
ncbi:hypothetical protein ACET3X_004276 [Alternaria dauci]|uniref:J domain-containing protein n=1 Tax=Alternaria dauci TaxID=48095 RepID=A0ABR3UMG0_9PLEO